MAAFTKSDFAAAFLVRSRGKAPVDVTGWAFEFVVKARRADSATLLRINSIEHPQKLFGEGATGRVVLNLARADMDTIGAGERVFGLYRADGGKYQRIATGRIPVLEGV